MSSFSVRNGFYVPPFQKESMDNKLITRLWNCIVEQFNNNIRIDMNGYHVWLPGMFDFTLDCWTDFFYCEYDNCPRSPNTFIPKFKNKFFKLLWNEVYDLLEFFAENLPNEFRDKCNFVLEKENSAYRFVGNTILEIISKEEIISVEMAMNTPFDIVSEEL